MTFNAIFASLQTSVFETMSQLAQAHSAINLGQGFPEGFEPPALIEAAAEALRTGPHQYPASQGLPTLRAAVAENAARFAGLTLDPDTEVLVTSGATEALLSSFIALIEPGDEAIIIEPAYDSYAPILRRAGATVVPVRLTPPDWSLTDDMLARAITPRTRLIVVNTPQNPIGKLLSDAEIDTLARMAQRHGLTVVSDEVYEHIVFDQAPFRSVLSHPGLRDRAVRIGSAGKSFSVTGWKVGYVSAAPPILSAIRRAHQFVTFTTPPALQAAVAVGLRFPDSYFDGLKSTLQSRRDLLFTGLRAAGFRPEPVPATYFATVAFDEGEDDLTYARRLATEARVAVIPVSGFYGDRDVRSHIRFCFAKPEPVLTEALRRLADWRRGALATPVSRPLPEPQGP